MSDMKKLKQAFLTLNTQGIMTHHNFWCCGGCASGGCENNYNALPAETRAEVIGAVYYHEQSADTAIKDHVLYLGYGALPSGDYNTESAIGQKIAEALNASGLVTDWNGDPSNAIVIPVFEVTLDEVPEGEGSTLHKQYEDDEDDEDDEW